MWLQRHLGAWGAPLDAGFVYTGHGTQLFMTTTPPRTLTLAQRPEVKPYPRPAHHCLRFGAKNQMPELLRLRSSF